VRVLLGELDATSERVHGEGQEAKRAALAAIAREGFWEDDARFRTLGVVEYVDRMEAATTTAQRLGSRLARHADEDSGGTGNLVSLLASRLLVLQSALSGLQRDSPHEVYLNVRAAADASDGEAQQWIDQVAGMYEAWALARGMTLERIGDGKLFCVSGLASGEILTRESGLHVLELISHGERGDRLVRRVSCVVEVAARDPKDVVARTHPAALATAALKQAAVAPTVVRRYRPAPTPLVRDAVRGYRTGRLDRVLAGDFDLFGDE
jgi:ATP-dependent Clp protease ATP-binding subunit ClpC